jgi:hypothetical protein
MNGMTGRAVAVAVLAGAVLGCAQGGTTGAWLDSFDVRACSWSTQGENEYVVLRPGHQIVLGKGRGRQAEQVLITVLDETERIAGVETRVVEERLFEGGQLTEIARNFFAICRERGDVFYFGEDVDIYEEGQVVAHGGSWRAGRNGARAGLMMPAEPRVGFRHHQEIAPGEAMDRAEIAGFDDTCETAAGTFSHCLEVIETSPLEPGDASIKRYAPGVGLIQDEDLRLIRYGQAESGPVAPPDGAPGGGDAFREVEIGVDQMPPALLRKIRQLYPTGRIHEVKREIHPGARVVYAVEVFVGRKQYDVVAGWRSTGFNGGRGEPYVLARLALPARSQRM